MDLSFLDAHDRDVRPPIAWVERWFLAGPYLYYRVKNEDHFLDHQLAPVTTLASFVVDPWSTPRPVFALDADGAFLLLSEATPEIVRTPGRWRAINAIDQGPSDRLMYLERRDDDLADVVTSPQAGPRILYRDVVKVSRRSLQDLPTDVSGRDLTGSFNLVITHARPSGRDEWRAHAWNDMSEVAVTTVSEDAACAAAATYLRERATRERVAKEEQQRLAAKLLADRVAACAAARDRGAQLADADRAARVAGDLAQARASALALHEIIALLEVPDGHARTSRLTSRLLAQQGIGVDWSARRPDRSLQTVAAWLPVAFHAEGNEHFWQTVEALVRASPGPPDQETYLRLLTYRWRLSPTVQAHAAQWAKVQQRERDDAALARGDWRGARSIAASLEPALWAEALLTAPTGLLGTQLIDQAIAQVPAGPLQARLRERRAAEEHAFHRGASTASAPSSGSGGLDGISELNRRMYDGNLKRYGLPRNY